MKHLLLPSILLGLLFLSNQTESYATTNQNIHDSVGEIELAPSTDPLGDFRIDSVSDIYFGKKEIAAKEVHYFTEKPEVIRITDLRGADKGWYIKASASNFHSTDGSKIIKGAELSFKGGYSKATSSGNISDPPLMHDVVFDNQAAKIVMSASSHAGRGSWEGYYESQATRNQGVQLKILEGSASAGFYQATIHWELSDAPQ